MAKKERKGKNKEVKDVQQEQMVDLETYVPNEEGEEIMDENVNSMENSGAEVTSKDTTKVEKGEDVVVDYDNSLPVAEAINQAQAPVSSETKKDKKKDSKTTEPEKKKYSFSDFMKSSKSISIPENVKTYIEENWDVFGPAMETIVGTPVPTTFVGAIPNNDALLAVLTRDIVFNFDEKSFDEPNKGIFVEMFKEIEQNLLKQKNVEIIDTVKRVEEGLTNVLLNKAKDNLLKIGIIDSKLSKDTEAINASEMYKILSLLSVLMHKDDLPKLKENFVKAAMNPEIKGVTIEHLIMLTV